MLFRLLSESDVQRLLPSSELPHLVDLMEKTLVAFSSGKTVQPVRSAVPVGPPGQYLGVMPGLLSESGALGTKLVNVVPANPARGLSSHLGIIALFEADTGSLQSIMDARYVTEIRTACVSAVSVRHMARPGASRLALIGTGVQARSHLETLAATRTLTSVAAWGPDARQLAEFSRDMSAHIGLPVRAAANAQDAVCGADLVVLATSSPQPVIEATWIAAGTHVVSVGACRPDQREMDPRLLAHARLVVDSRAAAIVESGDVVQGIAEGHFTQAQIVGELGQVAAGTIRGREHAEQLTVYKSLGLAVEDVATAALVYQRACQHGVGIELEL